MQKLVSIITPTFNSDKFVQATILSVQNQTYKNWELILIDDCSTDSTFEILKRLSAMDSRLKLFRLSTNSGTGVARDFALSKCSGNYIAFLDADDIWKPKKLEIQLAWMQEHRLNFTFSFYDLMDENGFDLKKTITAPKILSYRQLFFCNFVGNLTAVYNADFFGKIPISPTRKRQDWMLWLTILKQIQVAKPVPESLAIYRVRQNSISASKTNLLKYNYAVYKKFHGFTTLKSALCLIGFLFTQMIIKPFYTQKS